MKELSAMKVLELSNAGKLMPLKVAAREVPHAVIEPNYTCNRRCAACYNRFREGVKPFEQVTEEIDRAIALRNLETISILGGEPTLHPRLVEIVRYIKSKGLVCQILTNGLVFLRDESNCLLDKLVDAGLDRVVLHIDCGQGLTPGEVEQMRGVLFTRLEQRGVCFGLSVTLYTENLASVPDIMHRYARYRYFDGVLATLARDMGRAGTDPPVMPADHELHDVHASIEQGLGVQPSSFIPSNLDDQEVRWLIYFYYVNVATGATVPVSPRFNRCMRRGYRLLTGRHLFAVPMNPSLTRVWFLLTAVIESLLSPSQVFRHVRLALHSALLKSLRFQYIVLQSAPRVDADGGPVEICYHCPDATIRNGKLVPVCLADRISPTGEYRGSVPGDSVLADVVCAHLEEAA